MLVVNLEKLKENLRQTDPARALPDLTGGARYLYDTVYASCTTDMDIRLRDIDYSRFDGDDIQALSRHLEHANNQRRSVRAIAELFSTGKPICAGTRMFF